jgi:hypothetical protein
MTVLDSPTDTRRVTGRLRDPLLGWSAVAAALVTFAVVFIPHHSLPDDPTPAQVTDFFTANYAIQQSQPLMHSVGGVLMLVFLVQLAALLRDLGAARSAHVVRAAGTALVAVVVTTMGWVAAVVTLTGDIDGSLQETLYMIGWDFHFRLLYLLPLVLLPAGWTLRRSGAAVTGWIALVIGGLTAVAPLGYLGTDTWVVQYPAFMLFLLWTLGAGIALGLRGVRAVEGTA